MTNGDRIRAMSNDELHELEGICPEFFGRNFPGIFGYFECPMDIESSMSENEKIRDSEYERCRKCSKDWLAAK